jgi:phosphoserine phosphatase
MRRTRLRQYAQDFARDSAKAWAYPEIMAEVAGHRAAGRVLVLNTASPDFYAKDIARELGFDYCVATQAQLADPLEMHPRIKINNKEEAKIDAMKAQVPGVADLTDEQRDDHCYAYSDSSADLPLLYFGCNGVLIHPSSRLATIGIRNEWTLMHPRRPYSSKAGDMLAVVRQMLGLYPEQPDKSA